MSEISQEALLGLMKALKDPKKKALIMEGLMKVHNKSPLRKVKSVNVCESPTSMQRRRALQQLRKIPESTESSSSSESSAEMVGPRLPLDKVFKGVIAYVEIKLAGKDQSGAIKMILRSMGATVRDTFTRDVTHVIFKGGTFRTYQKANLLQCKLVSVLWIDACRQRSARLNEANYRAFGPTSDDSDISLLCNKLQKEYETIIKDEKRRSFSLPRIPKQEKRKTMHISSQSSQSSHLSQTMMPLTSADSDSSPDDSDCGVVEGYSFNYLKKNLSAGPSITSDSTDKVQSSSLMTSDGSYLIDDSLKENTPSSSNIPMTSSKSTNVSEMSQSLMPGSKYFQKTINEPIDMEITNIPQNLLSDSKKSETMGSLHITDSDKTASDLPKTSFNKTGTTMSSLRLSHTTADVDNSNKENRSDNSTPQKTDGIQTPARKSVKINEEIVFPISSSKNVSTRRKTAVKTTKSSLDQITESVASTSSTSIVKKTPRIKKNLTLDFMSSETDSPINKVTKTPRARKTDQISLKASESSSSDQTKEHRSRRQTCMAMKERLNAILMNLDDSNTNSSSENVKKTTSSGQKVIESSEEQQGNVVDLQQNEKNTTESSSDTSSLFKTPKAKISKVVKEVKSNNRRSTAKKPTQAKEIESSDSSSSSSKSRAPKQPKKKTVSPPLEVIDDLNNLHLSTRNCVSTLKKPRLQKIREIGLSDSDGSPSPKKKQQSIDESSTSTTKSNRRKLFNPDEEMMLDLVDDEEERMELNKLTSPVNRKQNLFIQPNTLPKKKKVVKRHATFDSSSVTTDSESTLNSCDLASPSIRRSQRVSMSERKPKYTYSTSSSQSTFYSELPIKRIGRRSTLDFQNLTLTQKQRLFKSDEISSIVCTKFHRNENEEFELIVAKLGRFYTENDVTEHTTHLVAAECLRTLNILRGLARGCWVLKRQWLLDSAKAGRWLPEEDYEMTEFSKAVQQCRLERQAFGSDYTMDIFKKCGPIYVGPKTKPASRELKKLIVLCKGSITIHPEYAKISIGHLVDGNDDNPICCVNESWILDSITNNKLEKTSKYLMVRPRRVSTEY